MSGAAGGCRVLFVTEGSPEVGLGHVSRCAALAKAVTAGGARASFVVSEGTPVASLLGGVTADVVCAPWQAEPGRALRIIGARSPDVVVVDSYAASPEFLAGLRALAQVVAVDDLADCPLPVDVVVNGGAGAGRLAYEPAPATRFLLGPRYALLDAAYAEPPGRAPASRVGRALICVGGGRQIAMIVAALGAMERAFAECVVEVAAGPFVADSPELAAAVRGTRHRVLIHRDRVDLRGLMLGADVAVAAAGVTLHELAATATPAVTVCMADNQRPNFLAFEEAGAALAGGVLGDPALSSGLESALRRLAGDAALRASLGARGRELVDGAGATRVARAILDPAVARR